LISFRVVFVELVAGQDDVTGDGVLPVGVDGNRAAEIFHLMADIGKPDAAGGFAGTVEFCRIARMENPGQTVRRNGAACVANMDAEFIVALAAAYADGYQALALDGLDSVGDEIAEQGQQQEYMQWRQAARHFTMEVNFLIQRARVFFLRMHEQPDNLVGRQVVFDMAVVRELLQACIDALMGLLDFVALAGDAQQFLRNGLLLGRMGECLDGVVDLIAVVRDIFGTAQGAAQLEGLFIKA